MWTRATAANVTSQKSEDGGTQSPSRRVSKVVAAALWTTACNNKNGGRSPKAVWLCPVNENQAEVVASLTPRSRFCDKGGRSLNASESERN